jgi:hypothetical protein
LWWCRIVGEFLAVDGEAIADRYVLFGAGQQKRYERRGLDLVTVLDWLAPRAVGKRLVAFAFHYDVCMLVRDYQDAVVEALMRSKKVQIGKWGVTYFPRRVLKAVTRGAVVEVFDVWGFFQCSFEAALRRFGVEPDALITWGKAARATFSDRDLKRIQDYNASECRLLEEMCRRLEQGLHSQEIAIRSWHGPGAIADAVLKRAGIRDEIRHPGAAMQGVLARAYFGGRIEVVQIGYFPEMTVYDINSAYPAAMTHLWDQSHGEWHKVTQYEPRRRAAVWHVRWNLPGAVGVGPLPFRTPDGRIYFPRMGRGWYWSPEVRVAVARHRRHVVVDGGYVFDGAVDSRLATIVPDLYHRRNLLRAEGRAVEVHVIKLALNSLYGKMAQAVGKAPFQAPDWAGFVTSYTRAKLREAVIGHEHDVVGFATDGVFVRGGVRLGVQRGPGLGEWKEEPGWHGWVFGSGLYHLERRTEAGGAAGPGLRAAVDVREGVRGGGFDWPKAVAQVNRNGYATVTDSFFVTPLLAILMPNHFGPHRGRWVQRTRRLAPWRDSKAKRAYHWQDIRDWNLESAGSTIPAGWDEESTPFDADWRAPGGVMNLRERPDLVIFADEA